MRANNTGFRPAAVWGRAMRGFVCCLLLSAAGVLSYAQEAGTPPAPAAAAEAAAGVAQGAGVAGSVEDALIGGGEGVPPNPRAGEAALPVSAGRGAASSFFALLRLVLVLAVIAAAAYGIIYFIKQSKKTALTENLRLKVLASVPINARAQAAVVAVGQKAYLVGAGESGVSLIAEITDKETVDAMLLDYSTGTGGGALRGLSFKSLIALFGRGGRQQAGGAQGAVQSGAAANLQSRRERLERL